MTDTFEQLVKQARDWARKAAGDGWLDRTAQECLDTLESGTPSALFDEKAQRPLLVAFFGGTGVGKSSLLNRLAGQAIARTGIERPTSREITLYLHDSLSHSEIAHRFPLDDVHVAYHQDERLRAVIWIDMPDFDSTDARNHTLVQQWLPHLDVVIYVVNPERYRDDKGWRILKAHGLEHAWLFVMNQRDLSHPSQLKDFRDLLIQGGFDDPLVLTTECHEDRERAEPDDFESLQSHINSLCDRHVIAQLQSRARQQRLDGLRAALQQCLIGMGPQDQLIALRGVWEKQWDNTRREILQGMEWPLQTLIRTFVQHDSNPLLKAVNLEAKEPARVAQQQSAQHAHLLWDDWAQTQLQEALDRLLFDAGASLPTAPLKRLLLEAASNAGKQLNAAAQRGLRGALAKPGNFWQRIALKLAGVGLVLLPLSAIGWVAYDVVKGFYESELHHSAYLGTDFAVHSGLLVALSWLLPYFLRRQLMPSAEKTAMTGLRSGIAVGLAEIEQSISGALTRFEADWQAQATVANDLISRCAPIEGSQNPAPHKLLDRMTPLKGSSMGDYATSL